MASNKWDDARVTDMKDGPSPQRADSLQEHNYNIRQNVINTVRYEHNASRTP